MGGYFLGIIFHCHEALREIHPFTLLTLRFGMGGLLLLLFQLQKDKRFLKTFSSKDWVSIILLALVGVSAHTLLQAYGLLYTTAINTGWLIAIMPICIVIAARFYLGEPISPLRKVGISLVFWGLSGYFKRMSFQSRSFVLAPPSVISSFSSVHLPGLLLPLEEEIPFKISISCCNHPNHDLGCLITFPFTLLKWEWNLLFQLS